MRRGWLVVVVACGGSGSGKPHGDATPGPDAAPMPTAIATGQLTPDAIAVSGTTVVWADLGTTSANGSIDACATSGGCGSATPPLVAPVTGPLAIAADATNVYYNNGVAIAACGIASCQPTQLAMNQFNVSSIALAGSNLVWTEYDTSNGSGSIAACAVSGCALTPTIIARTAGQPVAMAVDGSNVYFSVADGIDACPFTGCGSAAPTPVVTGDTGIVGIAVDGPDLFWVVRGTGEPDGLVRTCAIAACTPTTLASTEAQPAGVAVDTNAVYWVDFAGDEIRTCSRTACTPATLATLHEPAAIALDATAVYVAGYGAGEVARVAK